jgi:hypothetical protein
VERETSGADRYSASSYFQPEMIGGKLALCYLVPGYQDGKIAPDPGAVLQDGDTLSVAVKDPLVCNDKPGDLIGMHIEIQIWSKNASPAKLLRTEKMRWKRTTVADGKSMYCPEIPVFNNGKIERLLLKKTEQCRDAAQE